MDIPKNYNYNIDQVIINKYLPYLDLVGLPSDVTISTITLTCNFNTEFIIKNISKYLKQYSLPEKKKRNKNQKRKKFYNQETLIYRSEVLNNKINVKIFKNGSLQITGSKSLENFLESSAAMNLALTIASRRFVEASAGLPNGIAARISIG